MSRPTSVRSLPHYVVGIGLHTAIFIAIGPLVGTLVFGFVVGALSTGLVAGMFTVASFVVTYPLIVIGYMWAWKPALLTGVVVAAAMPFIDDPKRIYLLAVVVGIISSLVFILNTLHAGPLVSVALVAIALAGAAAAVVCTWIALRLRADGAAVEAG